MLWAAVDRPVTWRASPGRKLPEPDGEFEGKQIVSKESLDETKKPHIVIPVENPDKYGFDWGTNLSTYCLGWSKDEYRGEIIVNHGGWSQIRHQCSQRRSRAVQSAPNYDQACPFCA